jgi:hypothetical protein
MTAICRILQFPCDCLQHCERGTYAPFETYASMPHDSYNDMIIWCRFRGFQGIEDYVSQFIHLNISSSSSSSSSLVRKSIPEASTESNGGSGVHINTTTTVMIEPPMDSNESRNGTDSPLMTSCQRRRSTAEGCSSSSECRVTVIQPPTETTATVEYVDTSSIFCFDSIEFHEDDDDDIEYVEPVSLDSIDRYEASSQHVVV